MSEVKIIECPRDAMQGIDEFIPTEQKVKYIQSLLSVGFDTLDFGSFVSSRAIPQMRDTEEVLNRLDLSQTDTKLLAIIANARGALRAAEFEQIDYLGFPFSISETFQKRNANASIEESVRRVEDILTTCEKHNKELVIYISMAFGNPYNEEWDADVAAHWVGRMVEMGIKIISLSDTIGTSNKKSIKYLFSNLIPEYPEIEFGAHLHTKPDDWRQKVDAAYESGCRRFDGAIRGFGGCPMAADDLVGNMPTENLLLYLDEKGANLSINTDAFIEAGKEAGNTFPVH